VKVKDLFDTVARGHHLPAYPGRARSGRGSGTPLMWPRSSGLPPRTSSPHEHDTPATALSDARGCATSGETLRWALRLAERYVLLHPCVKQPLHVSMLLSGRNSMAIRALSSAPT
jgi:hypothetical protein